MTATGLIDCHDHSFMAVTLRIGCRDTSCLGTSASAEGGEWREWAALNDTFSFVFSTRAMVTTTATAQTATKLSMVDLITLKTFIPAMRR